MKRLVNLITNHPWVVLIFFTLITLGLGWHLPSFRIDASAETLLTKNNEHYIRTQVMNERFSPQEFLFVAYQPKELSLFSQQTYTNLTTLTEKLRQLDRVESVRSLLNVPLLTLSEGDLTSLDPDEWTLEANDFPPEAVAEALKGNPVYEELLVNEEQTATAIQVLFRPHPKLTELNNRVTDIQQNALERELTEKEEAEIARLQAQAQPLQDELTETRNEEIERIREIMTEYESDAELYLGGPHVLGYQLIEIIKNDLYLFGGLIAAMICLVLYLLFGALRWVLITAASCAVSLLMTIGLFGLLGLRTTVISSNFIALQLILTLAIVVHLIVQYREYNRSRPGWTHKEQIRAAFLRKAAPCFYAGLTTSVGFASLLFTGIQPVISFGWMMIIAVFFSIAVSLILFPALLVLFPGKTEKPERKLALLTLRGFDYVNTRRPGVTLSVCFAVFLLTGAGLFFLSVENSFINYFSEETQVYKELSFIDQEMGGSTPFDIVLNMPEPEDEELIATAEDVQQVQRVQEMLKDQKGMGKVLSIVNVTELAKEINDGKPLTEYELTAAYRVIDDELRDELVGSYYSADHQQLRISARVEDATEGLNRAQLIEDVRAGLEELGLSSQDYSLTNLFVLYQDILQRLFRSQLLSLGIVYAALTLTFFAVFRSVRIALIAITPNILSTGAVLGIMGWLSIPLDLMTITIASIAMGIAVDDTIHYIHRYRDELSEAHRKRALHESNFSVGYAMMFTSLIIILGFSQLGFSDFVPSMQFGLLSSLAMAVALIWNLTLLPVLLGHFVRGAHDEK